MSVNSLVISNIGSQYTAEYIANVFWSQNLAQVSSINLFPCLQKAYITIAYWGDSEAAYNLIQRLKNPSKKTRIIHSGDLWWPIKIPTYKYRKFTYYNKYYTTTFPEKYFNYDEKNDLLKEPAITQSFLSERIIPSYWDNSKKINVTEAIRRYQEVAENIMEANLKFELDPGYSRFLMSTEMDFWEELAHLSDHLSSELLFQSKDVQNVITEELKKTSIAIRFHPANLSSSTIDVDDWFPLLPPIT